MQPQLYAVLLTYGISFSTWERRARVRVLGLDDAALLFLARVFRRGGLLSVVPWDRPVVQPRAEFCPVHLCQRPPFHVASRWPAHLDRDGAGCPEDPRGYRVALVYRHEGQTGYRTLTDAPLEQLRLLRRVFPRHLVRAERQRDTRPVRSGPVRRLFAASAN